MGQSIESSILLTQMACPISIELVRFSFQHCSLAIESSILLTQMACPISIELVRFNFQHCSLYSYLYQSQGFYHQAFLYAFHAFSMPGKLSLAKFLPIFGSLSKLAIFEQVFRF